MTIYMMLTIFYLGGHPIAGVYAPYPDLETCQTAIRMSDPRVNTGSGITANVTCIPQSVS